jgi:hypothetical protein
VVESHKELKNNERHIMRIIAAFAFTLVFSSNVFSADKFELLVEARIPSLMTSAQNLTSLSENVLPGSSGIIGVAVASLAFNPKLAGFDLTSPIQILGFGSKTANKKELQWCIAMYPKDKNNPTMQINDKQRTIFVKGIGDRTVLSYHKELIGSITEIPAIEEKDEYDVKFVFYPRKYLDIFPDGISSLKKEITELALKKSGRSEEDLNNIKIFSIKMTELEKAVCQFSKTDLNINFKKDRISIKSEFLPAEGSSTVIFIKAQTKTGSKQKSCDTGTGTLISYGNIYMTDHFKNEIIETLKEILIETTDNYNPEISDFLSELIKSFSGEFRYKMDSFAPGSVSCLETSSSAGKYQALKNFISNSKKIKEVKKGVYSFNPGNADAEKYNSFITLNEKWSKIVYGKTKMSSIEKLITEGISSSTENQIKGDIFIYVFSDNEKNDRKPLFNSIFTFNENTLTIDTDIFEEGIKKAVPANLIPKKPRGNLEKE